MAYVKNSPYDPRDENEDKPARSPLQRASGYSSLDAAREGQANPNKNDPGAQGAGPSRFTSFDRYFNANQGAATNTARQIGQGLQGEVAGARSQAANAIGQAQRQSLSALERIGGATTGVGQAGAGKTAAPTQAQVKGQYQMPKTTPMDGQKRIGPERIAPENLTTGDMMAGRTNAAAAENADARLSDADARIASLSGFSATAPDLSAQDQAVADVERRAGQYATLPGLQTYFQDQNKGRGDYGRGASTFDAALTGRVMAPELQRVGTAAQQYRDANTRGQAESGSVIGRVRNSIASRLDEQKSQAEKDREEAARRLGVKV